MKRISHIFSRAPDHKWIFLGYCSANECWDDMACFRIKVVVSSVYSRRSCYCHFYRRLRSHKFSKAFQVASHPTITEICRVSRASPHFLLFDRVVDCRVAGAAAEYQDSAHLCRPCCLKDLGCKDQIGGDGCHGIACRNGRSGNRARRMKYIVNPVQGAQAVLLSRQVRGHNLDLARKFGGQRPLVNGHTNTRTFLKECLDKMHSYKASATSYEYLLIVIKHFYYPFVCCNSISIRCLIDTLSSPSFARMSSRVPYQLENWSGIP